MYCIEKHIYYCSRRIKDILGEYFTRDYSSKTAFHDFLNDKYISSDKDLLTCINITKKLGGNSLPYRKCFQKNCKK